MGRTKDMQEPWEFMPDEIPEYEEWLDGLEEQARQQFEMYGRSQQLEE